MNKSKYWWLEKDCKNCAYYSQDCPYMEHGVEKQRGCSMYQEAMNEKSVTPRGAWG